MREFGENYYKTGNYVDYLFRANKYKKLVKDLVKFMRIFDINTQSKILDYGCGIGYLVKFFLDLGYHNMVGYDISQWAVGFGIKRYKIPITTNIDIIRYKNYDLCFMLDVLEHMFEDEIRYIFDNILITNFIVVRIPVSVSGDGFYLDISNRDPTHVLARTRYWWINLFYEFGYKYVTSIQLEMIYDSIGVFCGIFKKIEDF